MARFDKAGNRVATTLFECAAWHLMIQVKCRDWRCGRIAVFNPHQLWWKFARKGWDDRLGAAGARLKCACGATGIVSALREYRAATVELPWPDEREWKRAVNRFRG